MDGKRCSVASGTPDEEDGRVTNAVEHERDLSQFRSHEERNKRGNPPERDEGSDSIHLRLIDMSCEGVLELILLRRARRVRPSQQSTRAKSYEAAKHQRTKLMIPASGSYSVDHLFQSSPSSTDSSTLDEAVAPNTVSHCKARTTSRQHR